MYRTTLWLLTALLAATASWPASAAGDGDLTDRYRETAATILGTALTDDEGWSKLTYLTTIIGHRLSGSPQLERTIEWASARMVEEGLDNVRKQPVMVPHWVRGRERAEILAPAPRELPILGLGRSVGTPEAGIVPLGGPRGDNTSPHGSADVGITAPVLVVESFEELEALDKEAVAGKIVVYAVPWKHYGWTVSYRVHGASRAARLGALAILVRSATGRSLATLHTGTLEYDEDAPRIPGAAITVEDADWFRRMAQLGREVSVRLVMGAQSLPDVESANVIAEIVGREIPEEIVLIGGHCDSWDVGDGAHDDGVGCIAAWQALTLLRRLGLRPRRTLRAVLYANEEAGLSGGFAYRESLGDAIDRHVAAIEMDSGAERPVGFGFGLHDVDPEAGDPRYEAAFATLQQIGRLLDGIGAGEIRRGGGGPDIGPLMRDGVPGLGLRTVGEHYFDWHHSPADTLDKVDPQDFRKAVAMLAIMGYVLADAPERLVPAG